MNGLYIVIMIFDLTDYALIKMEFDQYLFQNLFI
jgi:hypothetical protein